MKIYVKCKKIANTENLIPHNYNFATAMYGFQEMGFEIIPYVDIKDIYYSISAEDIVIDYIDQVEWIMKKFHKAPYLEDYPDILKPYMGRNVWKDTINNINANPEKWGVFVKPVRHKAFTGKVINSPKDLVGCGNCYENYEVLVTDVLDIVSEYRGFIYYDNLVDIRPYSGKIPFNSNDFKKIEQNWKNPYNPKVVEQCLQLFRNWDDRPASCSMDFAVLRNGKTVFLEMNDAYSLGCYGLQHIQYAKFISARWAQVLEREDECDFIGLQNKFKEEQKELE